MPGTALGSRKSPKPKESRVIDSEICIVKKVREDALDQIQAWLDRGKTAGALAKRKKRPTAEVNRDNFIERAENDYHKEKFKGVWKDEYDAAETAASTPGLFLIRAITMHLVCQRELFHRKLFVLSCCWSKHAV